MEDDLRRRKVRGERWVVDFTLRSTIDTVGRIIWRSHYRNRIETDEIPLTNAPVTDGIRVVELMFPIDSTEHEHVHHRQQPKPVTYSSLSRSCHRVRLRIETIFTDERTTVGTYWSHWSCWDSTGSKRRPTGNQRLSRPSNRTSSTSTMLTPACIVRRSA